MRWKHRIRIGKGNSMKVQLYLGYSVLLAFLAGLIGVFLFLGMRTPGYEPNWSESFGCVKTSV